MRPCRIFVQLEAELMIFDVGAIEVRMGSGWSRGNRKGRRRRKRERWVGWAVLRHEGMVDFGGRRTWSVSACGANDQHRAESIKKQKMASTLGKRDFLWQRPQECIKISHTLNSGASTVVSQPSLRVRDSCQVIWTLLHTQTMEKVLSLVGYRTVWMWCWVSWSLCAVRWICVEIKGESERERERKGRISN